MAEKSSDPGGADVRTVADDKATAQRPAEAAEKKPDARKHASPHEHAVAIKAHRTRAMRAGDVAVTSLNGQSVSTNEYSWQHNAAAALHGWAEHEHHEAKPLGLSLDDYKAALLAASKPVTRALKDFNKSYTEGETVKQLVGKGGDTIDSHKAAELGIPTHTDYEPHAPALSRHAAHAKKSEADRKAAEAAKA